MSNFSRRVFMQNSSLTAIGLMLSKYSFAQLPADYTYFSIAEISELVRQKKVSPVELVVACLKRIELLNPKLNAFITVTDEIALKEAKLAETEIANGKWKGPLHGIPIALKDNIDTAGIKTTAASGVYRDRIPTEDAEVTTLLRNAGAISLGKLNMHEFAYGTTSVVSYFGSVHNPWNPDYISGGSSGGSAVAVAAGLCYATMGTDTGGSIRLPAACCGVTGMKATYDLISTRGIVSLSQSMDHTGPICRTVEDIAIMLNAISAQALQPNNCKTDYRKSFNSTQNPKIGVVQNLKISDSVQTSFVNAIEIFHSLNLTTTELELPQPPPSMYVMFNAEVEAVHKPLIMQYKELYQPATIERYNNNIKETNSIDYINARNEMNENRRTISGRLFKDVDVIILPTTITAPLSIADAKVKGSRALAADNAIPFNYYGLPAISIPCGFTNDGLPLGLQVAGPEWGESKVLDVAHKFQKATNWHLKHPEISY
jgi:aspartyl-tRNA(Asn)/glutamyl-tRNA(Gln) amidotransferase subunit A